MTDRRAALARLSVPAVALAACACAHAVGIAPEVMRAGLDQFRPYTGRLQVKRAAGGATVIDDTYNANPDSVRAAIEVLAALPAPRLPRSSHARGTHASRRSAWQRRRSR